MYSARTTFTASIRLQGKEQLCGLWDEQGFIHKVFSSIPKVHYFFLCIGKNILLQAHSLYKKLVSVDVINSHSRLLLGKERFCLWMVEQILEQDC